MLLWLQRQRDYWNSWMYSVGVVSSKRCRLLAPHTLPRSIHSLTLLDYVTLETLIFIHTYMHNAYVWCSKYEVALLDCAHVMLVSYACMMLFLLSMGAPTAFNSSSIHKYTMLASQWQETQEMDSTCTEWQLHDWILAPTVLTHK